MGARWQKLIVLQALLVGAGLGLACSGRAADDTTATPKPRSRLDPALLVAPSPVPRSTTDPTANETTLLPRFEVKDKSLAPLLLLRRPGVEDPKGKFTLKNGGRFVGTQIGGLSVELGIWGHIDIMEPNAPAKCLDFLRIKW